MLNKLIHAVCISIEKENLVQNLFICIIDMFTYLYMICIHMFIVMVCIVFYLFIFWIMIWKLDNQIWDKDEEVCCGHTHKLTNSKIN